MGDTYNFIQAYWWSVVQESQRSGKSPVEAIDYANAALAAFRLAFPAQVG